MGEVKSFRLNYSRDTRSAFTIVELLAVLFVLALLGLALLPALASTHPNVQATRCINNMRQLGAALAMYSHDNFDLLPPNFDPGNATPGEAWVMGNASGWMPTITGGGSPDAGDPKFTTNASYSLLAPYLGNRPEPFQCPLDPRICPYSGSDSSSTGKPIKVVRNVALNGGVGTNPHKGWPATIKVDGAWLDGNHSHVADTPYATFGKMSDFRNVRPADTWTFVDADPWTIASGEMAVIAAVPDTVDYCNALHGNATPFAFADGRAEMHKWKSTVWVHKGPPSRTTFQAMAASGAGREDWFWWASHATKSFKTGTVP